MARVEGRRPGLVRGGDHEDRPAGGVRVGPQVAHHVGQLREDDVVVHEDQVEVVGPGDPPVFLDFPAQNKPAKLGEEQTDPTHSAVLGLKLEERLKAAGVEVVLVYAGRTHPRYKNAATFLIDRLKK